VSYEIRTEVMLEEEVGQVNRFPEYSSDNFRPQGHFVLHHQRSFL